MKFNVYLFEPEVDEFALAFRDDRMEAYDEVEFKQDPPFEAKAYLLHNKRSAPPPWVRFFSPHVQFPKDVFNISNSFVLLIKQSERVFALTYGQGYLAIDRKRTDPAFGLNIAVNAVLPDQIRSTESRNLKETATLKQLVLTRASSLDQFEVDFDHEVLHRLEGVLRDEAAIGKRIRGSASCSIVTEVEFEDLADWCADLLKTFGGKVPERMLRTQTLQPVRDDDLLAELDSKLLIALLDGSSEALHLSPTDVRSYNRVDRYELVMTVDDGEEVIDLDELDIDLVHPHLDGLDPESFSRTEPRIRGVDENDEVVADQPLLTTVVFETLHENRLYVHQPSQWVEISRSLVERLDRRLADFSAPADFSLPDWDGAMNEGPYNDDVGARQKHLLSLDRKLVRVAGSSIEACDLLSKNGDFIHVKEYKSSQSITHLVGQAQVASDLLLEDQEFRQGLLKKLGEVAKEFAPGDGDWNSVVNLERVRPSDHRIVLAIGAKPNREIPATLPYLGKQALFDTLLWLQRQGFPCFVYKIDKHPVAD